MTEPNDNNQATQAGQRRAINSSGGYATWPQFTETDAAAVAAVLRSGNVDYFSGNQGRSFEVEFSRHVGSPHTVALANGSVALEAALRSCGIGNGDEVIVSPRSYIASASTIVRCGARPIFIDVDPDTQNLDVAAIEQALTSKSAAIMCVHLAGWPCDMPSINVLAEHHNLKVIEDCAQAQGAAIDERQVGTFGHVSAFSFCQDKIMTTAGEGGALCINDDALQQQPPWSNDQNAEPHRGHKHIDFVDELPKTFDANSHPRMSEIQAAVGRLQLSKINKWRLIRTQHAKRYGDLFRHTPAARIPETPTNLKHAYYRYYLFVRPESLRNSWNRDRIVAEALERGLPCSTGTCPEMYREKALIQAGLAPAQPLKVAQTLGETSVALSLHPSLPSEQIDDIGRKICKILQAATR